MTPSSTTTHATSRAPALNTSSSSDTTLHRLIQSISEQTAGYVLDVKRPKTLSWSPQGYLYGIHTTQQLKDRLSTCIIDKVQDSRFPKLQTYQAYDVAKNLPYTVPKAKVLTLLSLKRLSGKTRVVMRCLHGALFFFIILNEEDRQCFFGTELWLSCNADTNQVLNIRTGVYSQCNTFYSANQYHNKETTLEKLLYSKAGLSITTLNLMLEEDEHLTDIPH